MKTKLYEWILPALFIITLTILVTRPFFSPGFIPVHDSTHPARLKLFKSALMSGQLPPIWAEGANHTLGYPLFHFYAPLFYYLATFISIFVPSYTFSINISVIVTVFLGLLGMYFFNKKRGVISALLSVSAFALLPYLAVNLYVRGSYAELLSISLLPWVFYSWKNLESYTSWLLASFTTTFFLLSHNLIPIITAPFLAVWILYHQKNNLKKVVNAAFHIFFLSWIYTLPLLRERSFVKADVIALSTDFKQHFVEYWQLWDSTWGFGGSSIGVFDGMSFKVGKLQILLGVIAVVFAILKKKKSIKKNNNFFTIFFLFTAIISSFMTSKYSQFIWDITPLLPFVQFPWRFLGLIGFSLSALSSVFLAQFKSKRIKLALLTFLTFLLLYFNLKYFTPQNDFRAYDETLASQAFIEEELAKKVPEYLPRWSKELANENPENVVEFSSPVESFTLDDRGSELEFSLLANEETLVTIQRSYYPTWKGKLDGVDLTLTPTESGLISFWVGEGEHTAYLYQKNTKLQRTASTATITFSIALLMILLSGGLKK